MKDKSKAIFLMMLMFMGAGLVSCGNSKDKDAKYVEKMLQDIENLDETYHPTPEQTKQLQEYYENAQKKLQQADSANQVKRARDSNLKQTKER